MGEARGNDIYQDRGINAHEDNEGGQYEQRDRLAHISVRQPVPFDIERAIEDALQHPEQIAGGQNHRQNRDGGNHRPDAETAREGDVLRHEARQPRQAERGETGKGEERRQQRHTLGDSAENGDFARVRVIVDDADAEEEHPGNDAMTEHLDRRPGQRRRSEHHTAGSRRRRHAEQDYAHVAHTGVRNQLLHVRLHETDARAVENVNDREYRQPAGELVQAHRQQREADADQAIRAHLEQDARQDHAHFGGRVGMGVGQPGMEREHRYLYGESQEDQQERQQLQADGNTQKRCCAADQVLREIDHTGRRAALAEIQHQDTNQHEDAAKERIQQELPGRIDAPRHAVFDGFVAPDADEQEHRGQLDFPE